MTMLGSDHFGGAMLGTVELIFKAKEDAHGEQKGRPG
jgi:hypothetical protein